MVTSYLKRLLRRAPLDMDEARELFGDLLDGKASPALTGAVLTALRLKGETAEDLEGAARAVLDRAESVKGDENVFDIARTGSAADAASFDVATASALVVASHGVRVVEHIAPSSLRYVGSFEVASHMALTASTACKDIDQRLSTHGIAFIPREWTLPALESLGRIAAELEVRTIVDLLPPLVNPAMPRFQLIGTQSEEHMAPLAQAAGDLGRERVWVVRGDDGLDELTLTAPSKVVTFERGANGTFVLDPRDYGFELCNPESLHGGSPQENAGLIIAVLKGEHHGPLADIVALNAGASLHLADAAKTLQRGIEMARDSVRSGKAAALLERLGQRD
jgi:anthranilate phosphoribosyltransferase